MPIMQKDRETGRYYINSRKYEHIPIEQVAQEDIKFLQWLFSDINQYSKLDEEAAIYLEDLLLKNNALPEKFL